MPRTCHLAFSDDNLELYAMSRLDEAQTEALEEHLLLCEFCRERVEKTDQFINAIRQALVLETPALDDVLRERIALRK